MTAYRDKVSVLDDRAIRQRHLLTPLFNSQTTLHAEEAEEINIKITGGFDRLSFTPFKAEGKRLGLARLNRETRRVRSGIVNNLVAILPCLVDGDRDGVG